MLFLLFCLNAGLYAQEDADKIPATVNIGQYHGSVISLLENLQRQTGYTFFYDKAVMDKIIVTQHFTQKTMGKVLLVLQQQYRLNFKVTGRHIAVRLLASNPAADVVKPASGRLTGTVVDTESGEPVNGATIQVAGKSLVSNIDGFFSVSLLPGKYTAQVSFVGYTSQRITDLFIQNGTTTNTVIELNRQRGNLSTVTVQASVKKDGIKGLLVRQKNNAAITDGISSEQIGRTPDKNIGEVLKRVSGLSTIDNRYVVVRGLSERYNGAMLNGQIMPSTELNRKNFNYEMIPSNMVDNVIVNKTITPDMSAEFGGGIVQVNTRAVPSADFATITAGLSANEKTTGKDFLGLKISGKILPGAGFGRQEIIGEEELE